MPLHLPRLSFTAFALALGASVTLVSLARADDWPQWRGPGRDGVWKEKGLIEKFAGPDLKPLWEVKIGSGYCGPTVAAGRVYVMDREFEPKQTERVYCFDSKTGEKIWSHTYDCVYRGVDYVAGPRASVTIHDGRAYSLGSMGHFHIFDAAGGKILVQKDLNAEYKIDFKSETEKSRMPIWGIASAPLIEGDLVILQIAGRPNACLIALDRKTGEERWKALNDRASYSAPIVIDQAGKRVLVCWTGDNVVGLNPTTGETYWSYVFKPTRMVISIATPVFHNDRLFVTSFYDGSAMLKLGCDATTADELWRKLGPDEQHTEALHSVMCTPYLEGDYVYGVDSYGELRCLDAKTGERIWESQKAVRRARWSNIHMVKNGDKMWMFNEQGQLLITKLSPAGFEEISRANLINPTMDQLRQRGGVCWTHPAFADKCIFIRNDEKLICASLAAE